MAERDPIKTAGVVDIITGAFFVVILTALSFSSSKDMAELRPAAIGGAIFGAVVLALGVLILRRKAVAALIAILLYGLAGAAALIGNLSDVMGERKGGGYILVVALSWGGYFHIGAWKELRGR